MASFPTTGQNPQWGPQLKTYIDEGGEIAKTGRLSEEALEATFAMADPAISDTYNADGTVATSTRLGVTRTYTYTNGNLTGVA